MWRFAVAKRSIRSVQYSFSILKSALNQAVKWRLIPFNPALGVEVPQAPKYRCQPYSPEESTALVSALREERFGALFILALTTGMRAGEICALKWPVVDSDNAVLRVEGTLTRLKDRGQVVTPPKTEGSVRVVPIPQIALDAIRELRMSQEEEREGRDWWNSQQFVFVNRDGGPIDVCYLSNVFARLLKRHGLRRIRLHDLRHSCASLLHHAGADIKAISEMLGHSQVGITSDLYTHLFPSKKRDLAARVDQILGGSR
jgi:integrase